jgi:cellobiose-specific phosphotransferase system component IIA
MRQLRVVTNRTLADLRNARDTLFYALQYAKLGGATSALKSIRRARKSVEGAIRHAERVRGILQ